MEGREQISDLKDRKVETLYNWNTKKNKKKNEDSLRVFTRTTEETKHTDICIIRFQGEDGKPRFKGKVKGLYLIPARTPKSQIAVKNSPLQGNAGPTKEDTYLKTGRTSTRW